jgi:uracil-DNA glycosylase
MNRQNTKLDELHKQIKNCLYLGPDTLPCGRDEFAVPHVTQYYSSQTILLITRDPSFEANKLDSVLNIENKFFKNKILKYLLGSSCSDSQSFEIAKNIFCKHIHWTHYQKCFPGKTTKGHKRPRHICACNYLRQEIEYINPELIIVVGKEPVEFISGTKLQNAIINNFTNKRKIKIMFSTHFSDANNASKNNSKYRFNETVTLIQQRICSAIAKNKQKHNKRVNQTAGSSVALIAASSVAAAGYP